MQEKEHLMTLGLTGQEAALYALLLAEGTLTGYEAAKQCGISRSNAYGALASLTEKGAAYLRIENTIQKYTPVPLSEFCDNVIRKMTTASNWLQENLPVNQVVEEGYVTIEGDFHILQKMRHLMEASEERVYLSCQRSYLTLLREEMRVLLEQDKKLVIITDAPVKIGTAKVYVTTEKGVQVGLIADSRFVIMGEYGEGSNHTCLYSGQTNFVALYKKALANEIKLIEFMKGENNR